MPENAEVYGIYSIVQDQHIMGYGGPVELNLIPVFKMMEMRGVEDKERCLELIRMAYHSELERFYRNK